VVLNNFISAIIDGKIDENIQAKKGKETVLSMNDIIVKVNK
jgi:hypothetical protein